jgi:hypothetical protein
MHDQSASRISGRTRTAVSAMCVRALRITVLKSAGNFTRYEYHDLNAEKIQRVKCFMFTRCGICRASNFRTPARLVGFENFWLWPMVEVAVCFAMSGPPPEAGTNRKSRHVRLGSQEQSANRTHLPAICVIQPNKSLDGPKQVTFKFP